MDGTPMSTAVADDVVGALDRGALAPVRRSPADVRVDRIDDDLWLLRLPLPYVTPRSVNGYLLRGPDGWTVVDPGIDTPDCRWPSFERALELAGVAPSSVTSVFVTHWHPDHAGLAGEVARRTGARIVAGRGQAVMWDRLRNPGAPLEERAALAASHGVPAALHETYLVDKIGDDHTHAAPRVDRVLDPGETLPGPSGDWRVVPLPGHSTTHYGLYDGRRRWLIGGDLAYAGAPPYLEWGHAIDPLAAHLASLALAERLRPRVLFAGHGPPERDPEPRLAASRAATCELAADVLAAVGAGASTAHDVTVALSPRSRNPDRRQSLLVTCLSVLEHAAIEGSVTSRRGDDGVRRFALAPGFTPDRLAPQTTYND
jgi:glyoxylase-like metal-dependent hydrolase (beta-lactamase superfamily II)